MNRVGIGFDLHRLAEKRPLILGGVEIEHPRGLEGHSDADVLLHALMDALLGAAGKRDIGFYFPPGEERWRGVSSLELLAEVKKVLERERWALVNADLVIIAEAPALAPHIEAMQENIAACLSAKKKRVTIKATTTEGLGPCGREEGIAAQAVVLLEKTALAGPAGQEAE